MKKIIYLLLLIPLFHACEKDANIDIPISKPQLVAACFVGANEDTTRLKLSWSSPIFYTSENNLQNESGATVILSKGNQQFAMNWDANTESYIAINTDFIAGDMINLDVTFKAQSIKSSSVIPSSPNYNMEYKGMKTYYYNGWDETFFEYNFTNKKTEETSYYRILFQGYYYDSYSQRTYSQTLWSNTGELYSFTKGESTTLKVPYYNYETNYKIDSIRYYIIQANIDYYKYHKSIYNYQGGEDFFVEPSIIYNNVEGGLGIFSCYNMVSDTTILK